MSAESLERMLVRWWVEQCRLPIKAQQDTHLGTRMKVHRWCRRRGFRIYRASAGSRADICQCHRSFVPAYTHRFQCI